MSQPTESLHSLAPADAERSRRLPGRRLTAGVVLAAVALLGACNSVPHTAAPTGVAASATPEATPTVASTPEHESTPDMLPLPNPAKFKNGQFLGAIKIDYKKDAPRPWSLVDAYYQNRGLTKPKMNPTFVHRIVAGEVTKQGADNITLTNLANGVVLDKTSSSDVLVMAWHDVTPVQAAVEVSGKTYEQTEMGINAPIAAGDTLTWLQPTNTPGRLREYTFVAGKSYVVSATSKKALNDMFVANGPQLRTYECWAPGSADQRRITDWQEVSAKLVQGSVTVVGGIGPVEPDK